MFVIKTISKPQREFEGIERAFEKLVEIKICELKTNFYLKKMVSHKATSFNSKL